MGINLFIVEKGTPGFSVSRKLDKVGNRSIETGELVFEDCRVPAKNMIGEKEGGGFVQIAETLLSGRITYGARCTGVAQAAYELSVQYAKERVQFGKPIIQFQANRFKLAEMATNVELARLMTCKAATLQDRGQPFGREAAMAKLFASENAVKAALEAVQIHGGYGLMREHPVNRFYRDAKFLTIGEGTSEIMHLVIARHLGVNTSSITRTIERAAMRKGNQKHS